LSPIDEIIDKHLIASLIAGMLSGSGSYKREEFIKKGMSEQTFGGVGLGCRDHGIIHKIYNIL